MRDVWYWVVLGAVALGLWSGVGLAMAAEQPASSGVFGEIGSEKGKPKETSWEGKFTA